MTPEEQLEWATQRAADYAKNGIGWQPSEKQHQQTAEPLQPNDSWQNLNSSYRREHPEDDVMRGMVSVFCFYASMALIFGTVCAAVKYPLQVVPALAGISAAGVAIYKRRKTK